MNKAELVSAVAEKAGISKANAEKAVKAFTQVVTDELASGGKVQLIGFGTFEVAERKERNGINPQTKAKMVVAASKYPKFKAGQKLKDAVK